MRSQLRVATAVLAVCLSTLSFAKPATAQQQEPSAASASTAFDAAAYVTTEFGDRFKYMPQFAPLFIDFDGDGTEDVALVARGEAPMLGEGQFGYRVSDPYHASFGYGDPKVTLNFGTNESALYVLIVHNWRGVAPANPKKAKSSDGAVKAKFVLANIPIDHWKPAAVMVKKKAVPAIQASDATGVDAAIYWDGKKYRWKALGASVQ